MIHRVTIDGKVFKKMVNGVAFAANYDKSHITLLKNIEIKYDESNNGLRLRAVDGYRMAIRNEPAVIDEPGMPDLLVDASLLKRAVGVIPNKSEDIKLVIDEDALGIETEDMQVNVKGKNGSLSKVKMPEYTNALTIRTEMLLKPLKKLAKLPFDKKDGAGKVKKLVKLQIFNEFMNASIQSGGETVFEHIQFEQGFVGHNGGYKMNTAKLEQKLPDEGFEIAFNIKFLLEALKSIEYSHIKIGFDTPSKPFTIEYINFQHLILPVRMG